MNSKSYQGGTGNESWEEDHHANFASFKENKFSEPFQKEDGSIDDGYMVAKYDAALDPNIPFLYGRPTHHFHRWIKAVWHIIPISEEANFMEILNHATKIHSDIASKILVRKYQRNDALNKSSSSYDNFSSSISSQNLSFSISSSISSSSSSSSFLSREVRKLMR